MRKHVGFGFSNKRKIHSQGPANLKLPKYLIPSSNTTLRLLKIESYKTPKAATYLESGRKTRRNGEDESTIT